MVLAHMAQSPSMCGRVRLRSTVSAIIAVSAAQAQNRYTKRNGQPNSVERPNIHMWMFGRSTLFGWPFLFVYLFCAWAALTAMIALTVERKRTRPHIEGD